MSQPAPFLQPAEAARQLGVSTKALRLYEQRGLIQPVRSTAGWRAYGTTEMAQAAEIIALRALGLSLKQVALVLQGNPDCLDAVLAKHRLDLERRADCIAAMKARVADLQSDLARGTMPTVNALKRLAVPKTEVCCTFTLPWPWGGERFTLSNLRSINYITGPLGSGKTRLAQKIAESLTGARYLAASRSFEGAAKAKEHLANDPELKARVDEASMWLLDDGAIISASMLTLLVALVADDVSVLVVDMIEQGLDQQSQEALMAYLRRRRTDAQTLILLTRSSAILDLELVGDDETIMLCPANHRPPMQVRPYPGSPGYEAVDTCLAPPDVRARTEGLVTTRR